MCDINSVEYSLEIICSCMHPWWWIYVKKSKQNCIQENSFEHAEHQDKKNDKHVWLCCTFIDEITPNLSEIRLGNISCKYLFTNAKNGNTHEEPLTLAPQFQFDRRHEQDDSRITVHIHIDINVWSLQQKMKFVMFSVYHIFIFV